MAETLSVKNEMNMAAVNRMEGGGGGLRSELKADDIVQTSEAPQIFSSHHILPKMFKVWVSQLEDE